MEPIQSAFKKVAAVVCLANEWRDTLSYAALAGLVANGLVHGPGVSLPLKLGVTGLACRESIRMVSWVYSNPNRIVGDLTAPLDTSVNSVAAGVIANTGLVWLALFSHQPHLALMQLLATMVTVKILKDWGKNLVEIPDLYFNKEIGMWDWPRKRGGGGNTQTQKVKDAFVNAGRTTVALIKGRKPVKIKSSFVAAPSPSAAPV